MARSRCALSCILLGLALLGCSGGATTEPTNTATPAPSPSPTVDPVIAAAVADAVATIDEIDRLFLRGPSDAVTGLMTDVIQKGRTSLAREPARVTSLEVFQIYDLSLQSLGANITLRDGAGVTHDHDWLMFTVRGQLLAVAPKA